MSHETNNDEFESTVSLPINTSGLMSETAEALVVQFRGQQTKFQNDPAKMDDLRKDQHRIVNGYLSDKELMPHEAARIGEMIDDTKEQIRSISSYVA